MVALLVGGAACAETPDATQDDSIEALRTRANAGDTDGQYMLAMRYFAGHEAPQDAVEAVAWHRKAAEQGHADAQYFLGVMSDIGEGVPQDDVEAYKWFNLATTYADAEEREKYAERRTTAGERLTPEQRTEGQKLAREWFAAHPPE